MQLSPYTPGTVASDVVGRERQLRDVDRTLAFLKSFPRFEGRINVFVGPRGVGKTSLLRVVQRHATELGFDTVWVTAGDGAFIEELIEAFEHLSHTWRDTAGGVFRELLQNVKLTLGFLEIDGVTGAKDKPTMPLGRQLQTVVSRAGHLSKQQQRAGLVVFIDEVQSADPDGLRALAYAWQHMQSEEPDIPVLAVTAGLSHSQDVITDAVSFAERFRYVHLENLEADAAREVLERPARGVGVRWGDAALRAALEWAGGYPYFLQLIGDLTWEAAGFPDAGQPITAEHVRTAADDFRHARDDFFRSRWFKASPSEETLIVAMASLGDGPIRRAAIAKKLGVATSDLSMARASLMDKGIVHSAAHGFLAFTAPGFAAFIRRLHDLPEPEN